MPDESIFEEPESELERQLKASVEARATKAGVPELPETEEEAPPEPAKLIVASDLLPEEERDPEPAELGFTLGDMYLSNKIVRDAPPQDPRHAYLFDPATAPTGRVRAFYVVSPEGTYGLVPWPGSTIIWPWEKAWEQDLYHEKQTPEKQAYYAAYAKLLADKKKKS